MRPVNLNSLEAMNEIVLPSRNYPFFQAHDRYTNNFAIAKSALETEIRCKPQLHSLHDFRTLDWGTKRGLLVFEKYTVPFLS